MLVPKDYSLEISSFPLASLLTAHWPLEQARSIGILSLKVYQQDGRALAWRLHPGTKKARKGNVGTSVEWRLNSKNDSRLHGQPSFASMKKSKLQ